jgi:transposase InsO family protein
LCYTEVIPDIKSATVTKAFFRGYKWFALHGLNIREVLTDNGSEFTAYTSRHARDTHFFETMLKIVDIKHRYTKPYRPQTNGKIKRFWKILNNECIRWQIKSQTEKEFIAELNGYMYRYNHQRRHSALKYQTPLDKLKFVTEIVKSYTAAQSEQSIASKKSQSLAWSDLLNEARTFFEQYPLSALS